MRRFDVFGRQVGITRKDGRWQAVFIGHEGKHRAAPGVAIPPELPADELARFLGDLFHESSSPERPEVVELPSSRQPTGTSPADDSWSAGSTYEDFMGRWSRPLGDELVRWMDPEPDGHWLDVGTGTGALTSAICRLARPQSVVACDPSAPFIAAARSSLEDSRVRFEVTGVGALPARDGGYDAVASALALNFFPDPVGALGEQLGLLRPGGRIAACVWDYADGMELLRCFWDAATAVHPAAAELDEGTRFPICNPDALRSAFESAGASRVRVEALEVPTVFADFEDYWRPLLGGTGPAPALVASLADRQRDDLKTALTERLGAHAGEPIRLTARAWAVAGIKP